MSGSRMPEESSLDLASFGGCVLGDDQNAGSRVGGKLASAPEGAGG